jgi:hypothetical protein
MISKMSRRTTNNLVGNSGLLALGIGPKARPKLKILYPPRAAARTGSGGFFLAA